MNVKHYKKTWSHKGYSRMDVLHTADAMSYGRLLSMIQRNVLPPSSRLKLDRLVIYQQQNFLVSGIKMLNKLSLGICRERKYSEDNAREKREE
jgi:hypothetical protein